MRTLTAVLLGAFAAALISAAGVAIFLAPSADQGALQALSAQEKLEDLAVGPSVPHLPAEGAGREPAGEKPSGPTPRSRGGRNIFYAEKKIDLSDGEPGEAEDSGGGEPTQEDFFEDETDQYSESVEKYLFKLKDRAGHPVAGAEVIVLPEARKDLLREGGAEEGLCSFQTQSTDAEGSFSFSWSRYEAEKLLFVIKAAPTGFSYRDSRDFEENRGEDGWGSLTGTMILGPPGRISGRVFGLPPDRIARLLVLAAPEEFEFPGLLPYETSSPVPTLIPSRAPEANGDFEFSGLDSSAKFRFLVIEKTEKGHRRISNGLVGSPGKGGNFLEIPLPDTGDLVVSLRLQDSRSAGQVSLRVKKEGGAEVEPQSRCGGEEGGVKTLRLKYRNLAVGRYTVTAKPWDREELRQEIEVLSGVETVCEIEGNGSLVLSGTVREPGGKPAAGATVEAVQAENGAGSQEFPLSVSTGADGSFALYGLGTGPQRVRVHALRFRRWEGVFPAGSTGVEINLEPPPWFRGRVDPAGLPMPRTAEIWMSRGGVWVRRECVVGLAGEFTLPLDDRFLSMEKGGKISVVLKPSGWPPVRGADFEADPGKDLDLGVFRKSEGRTLSGRVVNPAGAPLPRAAVSVALRDPLITLAVVRASAEGLYTLGDMPPEELVLTVDGGAQFVPWRGGIGPAGSGFAEVRLSRGGWFTGHLEGKDGKPVQAERLWAAQAFGEGAGAVDFKTDWRGDFESPRLAPGLYRLAGRKCGELGTFELKEGETDLGEVVQPK